MCELNAVCSRLRMLLSAPLDQHPLIERSREQHPLAKKREQHSIREQRKKNPLALTYSIKKLIIRYLYAIIKKLDSLFLVHL